GMTERTDKKRPVASQARAVQNIDKTQNETEDDDLPNGAYSDQRGAADEADKGQQPRDVEQDVKQQMSVAGIAVCPGEQQPDARSVVSQRLYEGVIAELTLVVETMDDRQMEQVIVDSEDRPGEKQRDEAGDGTYCRHLDKAGLGVEPLSQGRQPAGERCFV